MGHPYLKGIIADESIRQRYATTLAEVAQGHYQGAHFKQLIGHPGKYYLRSNRKVRLYGIFYRNYLIIIDEDLRHKLDRHLTFLNLNIDEYLKTHAAFFDNLIENNQFIACEKPNQDNVDFFQNRPLDSNYCPPTFYNDQWITPSREQQHVLKAPLPLSIGGGAGAGKTLIALWILKQLAINPGRYFYITEEAGLASYIGDCGAGMDLDLTRGIVSFVSYKQFLITVCNLLPEQLVDDEHLQAWLKTYVTRYKLIVKSTQQPSIFEDDIEEKIDIIIHEFLIRSRYSTPDDYRKAAGDRQSFFMSDPKKRNWLNNAYQAYEKKLSSSEVELVHPSFYKIADGIMIDGAVYDEVQNATLQKIENVRKCAQNRVAFLFDSNQGTKRAYPIRAELKTCLGKDPIELEYTFRCPVQVAKLADRVIQLKNHLSSGKLDKHEPHTLPTVQNKPGFVRWVDMPEEIQNHLAIYKGTLQMAVVVMDRTDLSRAKQLFPECDLVFTGEEIQGREYDVIVVLYPLDSDRMAEANKLLQNKQSIRTVTNRAKNNSGNSDYITRMNTLFTIITRALEGIYIIQAPNRQNSLIYEALNPEVSRANQNLPTVLPVPVLASVEDLQQEARKLETLGRKNQAEALREAAQALEKKTTLPLVENPPKKIPIRPQPFDKKQVRNEPLLSNRSYFERVQEEMSCQNIKSYIQENRKLPVTLFQKGSNNKSLFIQIMMNNVAEKHFLEALEIHVPFKDKANEAKGFIAQLCNIDEFTGMPNLFWLVKSLAGQITLMNLLRSNKDLINLVKDEIFHVQLQKNNFDWDESSFAEYKGKSIFYLFAQFDYDLLLHYEKRARILRRKETQPTSFLDNLICLKKLQKLTVENLLTPCQYKGGYYTAMNFFTEDTSSSRLAFLFKYNNFAKKITAACLFKQIEKQPLGSSLFFYLSLQPIHYQIIVELLKKPEIKKACTMQTLLRFSGPDTSIGMSPFFNLSRTYEGCTILASVIRYDEKFITGKMLYTPLPRTFGNNFGQSLFINLCRTDDGCKILSKVFIAQPHLLNEIPLDALTYTPEGNRAHSKEFPLFLLARSPYGCRILQHLVLANPIIAKKITLSVLSERVSLSENGPEQRTLALLLGNAIGRECFVEILNANKALEAEPFGSIICEIHETVPSRVWEFPNLINGSLFYILSDWSSIGLEILRRLVNPAFLHYVNSRVLNTLVGSSNAKTTAFFKLACTNEGCALLLDILKNNSDLIDSSLMQTLFDSNLLNTENVKISTLYLLAVNEKGAEIIDFILENYSNLIPDIDTLVTPYAALPRMYTQGSLDNAGLSLFRLLLRTAGGRRAVLKLLNIPSYANQIILSEKSVLDTYVQDITKFKKEDKNAKTILQILKPDLIKSFAFYQPKKDDTIKANNAPCNKDSSPNPPW